MVSASPGVQATSSLSSAEVRRLWEEPRDSRKTRGDSLAIPAIHAESRMTPPLGASFVIALLAGILHWLIKFKNQITSIVAGPGLHLSCSSSGWPEGFRKVITRGEILAAKQFSGCGLGRRLRGALAS